MIRLQELLEKNKVQKIWDNHTVDLMSIPVTSNFSSDLNRDAANIKLQFLFDKTQKVERNGF